MNERRTPDDDERDAPIDAAWRAQSREEPAAAIDDAIRAAARREAKARAVPAARPLQRWTRWTPIAAAAGIAVLAFGVVRWLPVDQDLRQPTPVAFPRPGADRLPTTAESAAPMQGAETGQFEDERDRGTSTELSVPESNLESLPRDASTESVDSATRQEAPAAAKSQGPLLVEPVPAAATPAAPAPPSPQTATVPPPAPPPGASAGSNSAGVANESRSATDTAESATARAPVTAHDDATTVTSARSAAQQKALEHEAIEKDSVRHITELYDAERFDEAANALRELRRVDAQADQRLPERLRAWAAAVRD